MKRAVLIILATGLAPLCAQTAKPKSTPVDPATAFAIAEPDENSPFFMAPQDANLTHDVDYAGRDLNDSIAEYPKSSSTPGGPVTRIRNFFGGMFASVNLGPVRKVPTTEILNVDPAKFPLQDRREVNVTYTIRNNTKNITRL